MENTYKVDYKTISINGKQEKVAIVSFFGELTLNKNIDVKEILAKVTEDENLKYLIVNLKETKYIDSSGLGIFLGTVKKLKARDGEFVLSYMNKYIESIFKLIHLDIVMKIFKTDEDALEFFKNKE